MFNEIYGTYYYMMRQILEKAADGPMSVKDLGSIVEKHGFAESGIYFTPDAVSQDSTGYNLLKKTEAGYTSVLKNKPVQCLSLNQKRLIKTIIQDKRIRLFMDDAEIASIEDSLKSIEPLYDMNDIALTETAADRDDFEDYAYRTRFRMLLQAVKRNQTLKIVYNSSHGIRKTVRVIPYKLEYGVRDDKFRLCGIGVYQGQPSRYIKLNVARMLNIIPGEISPQIDFESYIEHKMLGQPIVIEISDFRNGFERIFIGLSNYRRTSSLNEETGNCTMQIYCMDDDVQELLIVMLSFGPAIKVIGPPDFKEKYIERVRKQIEMLKAEE